MRFGSGSSYLAAAVPEAGSLCQDVAVALAVLGRYPDLKKVGVVLCGGDLVEMDADLDAKKQR